ncbi:hypothetical protein DPMN_124804 [Dreissena polymorpha]|uniref:Uncharacterized protein n=1 Tax=Dreissena polymorpha TaxID=45954 RepID=A0A9D4JU48_DREPO|nr:hypothetical protein DPMN_124804 [Dreissena polymorpha]
MPLQSPKRKEPKAILSENILEISKYLKHAETKAVAEEKEMSALLQATVHALEMHFDAF